MPNIYRANIPEEDDRNKCESPKKNNNSKNKKKKKDFKTMKKNTIKSLNDVEYFLNNFEHFMKYAKLYKLLKNK